MKTSRHDGPGQFGSRFVPGFFEYDYRKLRDP